MTQRKKHSRRWIVPGTAILVAAGLIYAFWPRPTPVDIGTVVRAPMTVTINEEGQTQVHDAYVVSTPFAGRLLRVRVKSGDIVEGGTTVVAQMQPANPDALDRRSREQAEADVVAAEAAVRAAQATMASATANNDMAESDLKRAQSLRGPGIISRADFDHAQQAARTARAAVDSARAGIGMKVAALDSARARLVRFNSPDLPSGQTIEEAETTPVTAPVSGRILHVMQISATTLAAGTPILEIGNVSGDLEVLSHLLSTDAVQVAPGERVIVDGWGGPRPLSGVVDVVEPWGFTKVSALGVEEQRVDAIIGFTDPPAVRPSLGHGYRVQVHIVIWEDKNALTVPSSALFREKGDWAVFAVAGGTARMTPVKIGHNNGTQAEVLGGLSEGATVIVYPGSGLADGARVARRTAN